MRRFHRVPMVAFSLLIALVGTTAFAPAASAAETIEVTGTVSNGKTFPGVVADARFEAHDITFLRGQLEGTVTVDGVDVEINVEVFHAITVLDSSTCERTDVVIGPVAVEEHRIEIQLDTISLEKRGGLLGGLFRGEISCVIDDVLNPNADSLDVAEFLNELLGQ
ncbi:hypothetical protein BH24CHL2_BH24CHL2_8430 [soil metagenome]